MPIEGRQDLHIMADTGRGRGTSGGRGSTDRKTCYGYGHGSAPGQGLMLVERAHDERHSHHFKGTGNGKGDAAGVGYENDVYRKRIGGRGDGFAKASGYIDKTGDGDDDILTCGTASGMGTPRCNGK